MKLSVFLNRAKSVPVRAKTVDYVTMVMRSISDKKVEIESAELQIKRLAECAKTAQFIKKVIEPLNPIEVNFGTESCMYLRFLQLPIQSVVDFLEQSLGLSFHISGNHANSSSHSVDRSNVRVQVRLFENKGDTMSEIAFVDARS